MRFCLESEEMVVLGRKKLIEENLKLKDKIEELEIDIKIYRKKENDRLKGKHFPDVTCKGCKHFIEDYNGFRIAQYCALNCECKDRTPAE